MRAFHFESTWEVAAPPAQVHAVLVDLEHYPDWWPQVLAVAKIDDETARVLCRSVLPYTLDLVLGVVHRDPALLETTLEGDLAGEVRWRLSPVSEAPGWTTSRTSTSPARWPGSWPGRSGRCCGGTTSG